MADSPTRLGNYAPDRFQSAPLLIIVPLYQSRLHSPPQSLPPFLLLPEMNNDKKLFLLDAMALIYRAYFALQRNPRITSKGRNTNAQFGFTTTLLDLLNKEKPSH